MFFREYKIFLFLKMKLRLRNRIRVFCPDPGFSKNLKSGFRVRSNLDPGLISIQIFYLSNYKVMSGSGFFSSGQESFFGSVPFTYFSEGLELDPGNLFAGPYTDPYFSRGSDLDTITLNPDPQPWVKHLDV